MCSQCQRSLASVFVGGWWNKRALPSRRVRASSMVITRTHIALRRMNNKSARLLYIYRRKRARSARSHRARITYVSLHREKLAMLYSTTYYSVHHSVNIEVAAERAGSVCDGIENRFFCVRVIRFRCHPSQAEIFAGLFGARKFRTITDKTNRFVSLCVFVCFSLNNNEATTPGWLALHSHCLNIQTRQIIVYTVAQTF